MSDLLPERLPFRVTQAIGAVTRKVLDELDHLVIVVPPGAADRAWSGIPDASKLRALLDRRGSDGEAAIVRSRLANKSATGVTLSAAPRPGENQRRVEAFALLRFAGEAIADALANRPRSLGILVSGFDPDEANAVRQALLLAAGAHSFRLPDYRKEKKRESQLQQVRLLGLAERLDLARTLAEIEAANLVRWLTALPPNRLTAASYRDVLAQLAEHHDWSMRFLDTAALKNLGAGAFLAVAQGNATRDAGIAHLSYRPRKQTQPDVALVGKGVIFDTGGTNLKSFAHMKDMHQDMCGSAVALGVLLAITRLKLPISVDCWLALTENRISAAAYKPRDVVTAANGLTIEVLHTDAEGRMALADTLVLAGREKPALMVDYATLTGACIGALTERYSGVFTNRPALTPPVLAAGKQSGERIWPFPMDADFDEDIKSNVADILQCSAENAGDHILAARFLQRFVPKPTPWLHVDLSSAWRKQGLAHVPGGVTGFGVRLTLNLLLDQGSEIGRLIGRPLAST
jgi:leucyl aminopeptidase